MMDDKQAGWLRNLFQQERPEASPQEAEAALDESSLAMSRRFGRLLLDQGKDIERQLRKVAQKYGVDPLYVFYNLARPTRYWPTMQPKFKEALTVARQIVTEGALIPSFGGMQVPPTEQEMMVDGALSDLASWVSKDLLPKLRKRYFKIVDEVARPYVRTLRQTKSSLPPVVDVGSQISGYFRNKVETGREMSPLRFLMLRVLSSFGK